MTSTYETREPFSELPPDLNGDNSTVEQIVEKKHSVMVLDDDGFFQDLIGNLLKAHGYDVWPARSVAEASSFMAGRQPDLIIVDYRLPIMDGITWITKLRESGKDTPVIFVSGTWCDASTFNWLRNILKVSLVFRKPIDPHLFLQAVEDVLPGQKSLPLPQETVSSQNTNAQADYSQFLQKGNFDQSLQKLDELIKAAGNDPMAVNELTQIRRKVRTQRVVHNARVEYIGRMPVIWLELVERIADARKHPADHSLTSSARECAHKLNGTSGSYGLSHISEVASQLENFLKYIDPSCTVEETKIYWTEIERLVFEGNEIVNALTHIDLEAAEGKEERLISVLLVTDNEAYRTLISQSVACNIDVHVVNSAAGALTRAGSMAFDVVVIDLSLDSSDLIAKLTKNLRSQQQDRQLPFIFIADPSQYSDISELIYGGCAGLLEPPVTAQALNDAVSSIRHTLASRQKRILCVDDDPMLGFFLTCVLNQEGFDVQTLTEPIHILETLEDCQPDLILLDVIMPGLSGYEVCRMLRSTTGWGHVPIVFLTVKNDMACRAAAFQAGGNDFLAKPVVPQELIARVKAQLAVAEMEKGPNIDKVSGVLQWKAFKKQASRVLHQCNKENIPASLGVIVIEGFNKLDYIHGEYAKQQVLAEVGELLSIRFRTTDIRGVLKDGAFAILFRGESSATSAGALARLHEEVSHSIFTSSTGNQFKVTLKLVVTDAGQDGLTLDSLVQCAVLHIASSDTAIADAAESFSNLTDPTLVQKDWVSLVSN